MSASDGTTLLLNTLDGAGVVGSVFVSVKSEGSVVTVSPVTVVPVDCAFTTTEIVTERPSYWPVTVALPSATPVTTPEFETDAIVGLSDDHLTPPVTSKDAPFEYVAVTTGAWLLPTRRFMLVGTTLMETSDVGIVDAVKVTPDD
ncbi:hypothetical protein D3C81_1799690 [compost metagenome]